MTEDDAREAAAWGAFWARGSGRRGGSLVAEGYGGIDAKQSAVWREFARGLPRAAKVLDLASGDGIVLRKLLAARRDLKAIGVDRVKDLPEAPPGSRLRGNVDLADLPFGDASFDAVTSQFGFEYADMIAGAREIARVLRPGGRVGMIVHRADGPIVAHNLPRRAGLRWVIDDRRLIARARAGLALRAAGLIVAPEIARAPAEAAARFGAGSTGWELAEAIVRTLRLGAGYPVSHVAGTLDDLDARARNEIGRIDSLERAANEAGIGQPILNALADRGIEMQNPLPLAEAAQRPPFATWITGRAH